jgi:ATP synthase F1 delta subunit
MIEAVLADRYAAALAEIAKEKNIIDKIDAEMVLLADIMSADQGAISVPELTALLGMPRVSLEEKIRITDIMLDKLSFSDEVGNLLNVLISKNRVNLIGRITKRYRARSAKMKNLVDVEVESAYPLSENDRHGLKSALEASLGRSIDMTVKVNKEIIAGIKVWVSGKMIDGSIAGSLERIEAKVAGTFA